MEMSEKVEKEKIILAESKEEKVDVTMDPEGDISMRRCGDVVVCGGAAEARARPGARQAGGGQPRELSKHNVSRKLWT